MFIVYKYFIVFLESSAVSYVSIYSLLGVYFMPIHYSRPKFNVDFKNRCLEAVSVIRHVKNVIMASLLTKYDKMRQTIYLEKYMG